MATRSNMKEFIVIILITVAVIIFIHLWALLIGREAYEVAPFAIIGYLVVYKIKNIKENEK